MRGNSTVAYSAVSPAAAQIGPFLVVGNNRPPLLRLFQHLRSGSMGSSHRTTGGSAALMKTVVAYNHLDPHMDQ